MSGITIRPARRQEAASLSALCKRSKAHWGYDANFMRLSDAALTVAPELIASGRVLVAERDGAVLGLASLAPLADEAWDLLHLFVDPAAIGTGAGRALFDAVARMAGGHGGRLLSIQADPHAEAFYLKLGARRVGEAESESVPGRLLPMLAYDLAPSAPRAAAVPFSPAESVLLRHAASLEPKKAAQALLNIAKTFWRAGEPDKFAEAFRLSYIEQRFVQLEWLSPNFPNAPAQEMRDMAHVLLARGIAYAPVIAALAIASAKLGDRDTVRRLVDYEHFFRAGTCVPPDAMPPEVFHAALAEEIRSDLTFYGARDGLAIREGWRRNGVMTATSPALRTLQAMLQAEVDRYIAALPRDPAHPFVAARPPHRKMGGWAVVSGPESHHALHLHGSAWLTGVYYVTQPEISRHGRAGRLCVGPPPEVAAGMGWETRIVEPVPGSFVLMPAYFFHGTEPMGVAQDRICIAFEAQHDELKFDNAF